MNYQSQNGEELSSRERVSWTEVLREQFQNLVFCVGRRVKRDKIKDLLYQ